MQARLLAFAATLLPLAAQANFDLDKLTPGRLGSTLSLRVHNAPANRLFLTMMSYSSGPTPIGLFDPADPRSIELGMELASNWYVLATSGAGTATIPTNLPNDPVFHAQVLHWQTATFPGTNRIVDQLSNRVATQLGTTATGALLPNTFSVSHGAPVLCWNRTRDAYQGDLLVVSAGGTDLFSGRTLQSQPGPAMVSPRGGFASATLNDGRVLFTGGVDATGTVVADCEIYDPATNAFALVAPMPGPRAGHAAATLPDGRVLVVGGTTVINDLIGAVTNSLNTASLYNPTTNTWAAAAAIGGRRIFPSLTKLNTGRMLVAGGIDVTVLFGIPIALASTNRAQLYNPATNAWANAANMPFGRAYHHDNQVVLGDGRVLLSGGVLVPDLTNAQNAAAIANADLYNPTTNTWTTTTMSVARTGQSATLLANGLVAVTGGASGPLATPTALDLVSTFDPTSNTWADLSNLNEERAGPTAVQLPDGTLLVVSGTTAETVRF
jgi:N-acetylneuraminic acid mutarotase